MAKPQTKTVENIKPPSSPTGEDASANITRRIQDLGDWRGETLAHVRKLIHDADPDIQEEWKWRGELVWEHDGGICGRIIQAVIKLTFHRGASLAARKNFSIPAWKGTHGVRSTSTKARRSTNQIDGLLTRLRLNQPLSSNSSAPRLRLTPQPVLSGQLGKSRSRPCPAPKY